jgi:hypothetical protein
MKTKNTWLLMIVGLVWLVVLVAPSQAQRRSTREGYTGREVYTGNIFYFGGPRGSISTNFTLTLTGVTPSAEVDRFISALQRGGQDELMKALHNEKRGTIQIGAQVGRDINAAWISTDEEEGRKLTILFERWSGLARCAAAPVP